MKANYVYVCGSSDIFYYQKLNTAVFQLQMKFILNSGYLENWKKGKIVNRLIV